jgi:hypothetical protein
MIVYEQITLTLDDYVYVYVYANREFELPVNKYSIVCVFIYRSVCVTKLAVRGCKAVVIRICSQIQTRFTRTFTQVRVNNIDSKNVRVERDEIKHENERYFKSKETCSHADN